MNDLVNKIKSNLLVLILFLFIFFAYYFFVTRYTMDLFRLEMLSYVFDSLARNLLMGNSTVDFSSVEWEAFYINNKFYAYWGPFPAFLRMITFIIGHPMYGLLTRLSCYLASIVSLVSFIRSIKLVTKRLSGGLRNIAECVLILGVAFASPLFFLIQNPDTYFEVMSWGLAFSITSIYYILSLLEKKDFFKNMFYLSFFAGLSLLVRPTFAIPLIIVFSLFFIIKTINHSAFDGRQRALRIYVIIALPLLLCTVIQLCYNYSRTGSVNFLYYVCDQYVNINKQDSCKLINGFDLRRIGVSINDYFFINKGSITSEFPFVSFYLPEHSSLRDHEEVLFPFVLAYSWLVFGALIFFTLLLYQKNIILPFLISTAFFIEIMLVSSYQAVTNRYDADFLPFFLFVNLFMLSKLLTERCIYKYKKFFMAYALLLLINIPVSILSSLTLYEAEREVYNSTVKGARDPKSPNFTVSPHQFTEKSAQTDKIINFFNRFRH